MRAGPTLLFLSLFFLPTPISGKVYVFPESSSSSPSFPSSSASSGEKKGESRKNNYDFLTRRKRTNKHTHRRRGKNIHSYTPFPLPPLWGANPGNITPLYYFPYYGFRCNPNPLLPLPLLSYLPPKPHQCVRKSEPFALHHFGPIFGRQNSPSIPTYRTYKTHWKRWNIERSPLSLKPSWASLERGGGARMMESGFCQKEGKGEVRWEEKRISHTHHGI